jgi:hypothetical protein
MRLQEVNGLVEKTKEHVRHLSTRQHRENSYPLILLLEGTKKLVDKIHQGSQNVVSWTFNLVRGMNSLHID